MNVYDRYAYPTEDLCFAPLPSQLWTKRAELERGEGVLAAYDALLGGEWTPGLWLYYRKAPTKPAACTDFDEAPKRPRYGACVFHFHALG